MTYLRVNFFTPGAGFGRQDAIPVPVGYSLNNFRRILEIDSQNNAASYLKELTYKSASPAGLTNAFRLIKELQKRYKQHEAERKELEVQCENRSNPKAYSNSLGSGSTRRAQAQHTWASNSNQRLDDAAPTSCAPRNWLSRGLPCA